MDAPLRFLSASAEAFPDFNPTQTSCAILCEAGQHLLFVSVNDDSQAGRWGLPGGNLQTDEAPLEAAIRIFKDQTKYQVSADQLSLKGERFARISGVDSAIHFFNLQLNEKPQELESFDWISIFALHILDNIGGCTVVEGRKEALDVVYRDRIWRRVENNADEASKLKFHKGGRPEIVFHEDRKLVISIIGKPCSGKATQATLLAQALAMVTVSEGAIFHEEKEHTNAPLPRMITAFDEKFTDEPYPSEIPLGMIGKRLTRDEYSAGFVLGGVQYTEEMCKFLAQWIIRSNDVTLPILLNISDEDVRARFPEESTEKEAYELRLTQFNESKDSLKLFEARNAQPLPLTAGDNQLKVFHQIALLVQKTFDELARKQQEASAKAQEPKAQTAAVPPVASRSFSIRDFLIGSVCTVAVIAGGIFYLNKKE